MDSEDYFKEWYKIMRSGNFGKTDYELVSLEEINSYSENSLPSESTRTNNNDSTEVRYNSQVDTWSVHLSNFEAALLRRSTNTPSRSRIDWDNDMSNIQQTSVFLPKKFQKPNISEYVSKSDYGRSALNRHEQEYLINTSLTHISDVKLSLDSSIRNPVIDESCTAFNKYLSNHDEAGRPSSSGNESKVGVQPEFLERNATYYEQKSSVSDDFEKQTSDVVNNYRASAFNQADRINRPVDSQSHEIDVLSSMNLDLNANVSKRPATDMDENLADNNPDNSKNIVKLKKSKLFHVDDANLHKSNIPSFTIGFKSKDGLQHFLHSNFLKSPPTNVKESPPVTSILKNPRLKNFAADDSSVTNLKKLPNEKIHDSNIIMNNNSSKSLMCVTSTKHIQTQSTLQLQESSVELMASSVAAYRNHFSAEVLLTNDKEIIEVESNKLSNYFGNDGIEQSSSECSFNIVIESVVGNFSSEDWNSMELVL